MINDLFIFELFSLKTHFGYKCCLLSCFPYKFSDFNTFCNLAACFYCYVFMSIWKLEMNFLQSFSRICYPFCFLQHVFLLKCLSYKSSCNTWLNYAYWVSSGYNCIHTGRRNIQICKMDKIQILRKLKSQIPFWHCSPKETLE